MWFIKQLRTSSYHHFKDYTTKYKFLVIHKEHNLNNKYKVMVDQFIGFVRSIFGQFLCSECFYYYSKKNLIVTHDPYIKLGMESEGSPYYCSEECVMYRTELNEQYLVLFRKNNENS